MTMDPATSTPASMTGLPAWVRAEFDTEVTYLNTASVGLPPRRSSMALQADLEQWRVGRADPALYQLPVEAARASYASLLGVPVSDVAVASQVSVLAGVVAASLPPGSEVLVAEGDFTSIVFPFMAQDSRGVVVREVPLAQLAASVRPSTTLVAVSAVQSSDGRVADLDALVAACNAVGARILLDVTQAAGWFPVDASRFAYTACAAYKWLLSPRGAAFFTIRPELRDELVPQSAGWFAGEDRWTSMYGGPLRLAQDARRFDVSPAWHAWVGTAPAIDLLCRLEPTAAYDHGVGLANRFLVAVGLPESESAIVSIGVDDGAAAALQAADVSAAMRAGQLRLSFHINNDARDVDAAVAAIGDHVL